MFKKIKLFCDSVVTDFNSISDERKLILKKITHYIQHQKNTSTQINLVYVCTHNSRRSHFGQVWAQVAANYYGIKNVSTFSGGTQATAFNINAINALRKIGFMIDESVAETNPVYPVFFSETNFATCFSKVYNHATNPTTNFAAIMTCGDAETNCPFIPNVDLRIATTYTDPKVADNTALEAETYYSRCKQIATEVFYVFSLIK